MGIYFDILITLQIYFSWRYFIEILLLSAEHYLQLFQSHEIIWDLQKWEFRALNFICPTYRYEDKWVDLDTEQK